MRFFRKKQLSRETQLSQFLKEIIQKIENNELNSLEKTNLLRFYLSTKYSDFSRQHFDQDKMSNYLFLGWWVTNALEQNEV